MTVGQLKRKAHIHLSFCMGKLLTHSSVTAGVKCEDTVRALNGHYGDHQLAATFRAASHYKILQQPWSNWPTMPLWVLGVAHGLHRERGSLFVHQWSEGLGHEIAPPHGRQQVPQ
jgi:hypothetical protein